MFKEKVYHLLSPTSWRSGDALVLPRFFNNKTHKMANYHDARIPLEHLSGAFGHTKSIPEKLLVPEVQDCEFNVLSDGSAEVFFSIRGDYDGTARLLPPSGPSRAVSLHVPEDRALDCVAHSGVADVSDGMLRFSSAGWNGTDGYDAVVWAKISEEYIKQVLWEHSRELVLSYLCLFRIGWEAQ